jgi:hypothetical protein
MHRKLIGVATGATLVLSMLTIGVSTASATSSVTCKSLKGTISTSITVGTCTPTTAGYTTATAKSSAVTNGGTLKWAPSGKTTIISKPTVTPKGQGSCPAGQAEYDAVSKVTGGTATYTKKGDVVKGRVCLNPSTGALTLVHGTTFSL